MARRKGWTCRRQAGGVVCGASNHSNLRLCWKCRKAKPKRKRPAHMAALEQSYEVYLERNNGREECAICGVPRRGRRLDRDHDHKTGKPRGLLCHRCNRQLPVWMTPDWLRLAADYLQERS